MAADTGLLETALDPAAQLAAFTAAHPNAGAIVSFLGQVRGGAQAGGGGAIQALELQHYPPLTLPGIAALAAQIIARWQLEGLLIRHRIGVLTPGEPIVLVAAAARHRRAAFEATDCAMDQLKSAAWLWKRERRGGQWHWIEPRREDQTDLARWDLMH